MRDTRPADFGGIMHIALLLLLGGCSKLSGDSSYGGTTNQDFLDDYSAAWCTRAEECHPGTWASQEECLADYDEWWGNFASLADECALDPSQAQACVDAVYAEPCDTLYDSPAIDAACNDLWEC